MRPIPARPSFLLFVGVLLVWLALVGPAQLVLGAGCKSRFDGFGVHLGAMHHFNSTNEQVVRTVVDKLHFELQLRHFRTSYEPYFSPSEGVYDIRCSEPSCTWAWESLLAVAGEPRYRDPARPTTFIASIWSPPYFMKDPILVRLRPEYEPLFHHFIRNVTTLIHTRFGIQIERVSPVNEPENVFAPWDHTNTDPMQLCRMVRDFADPLVSACTENSYFWVTELYLGFRHPSQGIDCRAACEIVATHAYALNINPASPNFLLAYYDLVPYEREEGSLLADRRIWQTEVSSTFHAAQENQMGEGLDLATNILNFVGTTCVERYYFWSAFTIGPSGESLVWGSPDAMAETGWRLLFPKKYFIFNHFTNASAAAGVGAPGADVFVERCTDAEFLGGDGPPLTSCLKFDARNLVFVNKELFVVELNAVAVDCSAALCCTTAHSDVVCDGAEEKVLLPPQSVCRCEGQPAEDQTTTTRPTTTTNSGGGGGHGLGTALVSTLLLVWAGQPALF